MENQKIINLLDKIDTDSKHFATKKWCIINDEINTNYGVDKDTEANNPDTIKYDTRVLKPNLCDYAEAYILVDGANYQDSSATIHQYKRDEPPEDDTVADLTANNLNSFKYKIKLLGNIPQLAADTDAARVGRLNVKIVVPLKYLINFFRSLEMPLINCKIKLNLTWKKECVLSTAADDAVFIINDTKLYVPVVTLSKEDNKDFIEQQNNGLQRSIYWNEYETKEINENADANVFKYINLDPSFQGVKDSLLWHIIEQMGNLLEMGKENIIYQELA